MRPRFAAAALLLLTLMGPATAEAQDAADPAADPFRFTTDAALILWQVQREKAEDFDLVWRVIRQRAEANAGAEVRAIVMSIRIYHPGIAEGDALTYVFHIDPVVKGGSYSPTFLLFESKLFERAEADELFAKMSDALMAGDAISTMPLNRAP
jgi:hypothetical protein